MGLAEHDDVFVVGSGVGVAAVAVPRGRDVVPCLDRKPGPDRCGRVITRDRVEAFVGDHVGAVQEERSSRPEDAVQLDERPVLDVEVGDVSAVTSAAQPTSTGVRRAQVGAEEQVIGAPALRVRPVQRGIGEAVGVSATLVNFMIKDAMQALISCRDAFDE